MRLTRWAIAVPVRARYVLAFAWAGFVLATSVVDPPTGGPPVTLPLGIPLDKVLHAASYGALAGLLSYARRPRALPALVAVVAVVGAYGLGIELVQAALPYRSFDLVDAAVNGLGATAAAICWRALVALDGDLAR